jgi:hypothetical protein
MNNSQKERGENMKNKARLLLPTIITLSLILAACKGNSSNNANETANNQAGASLSKVNTLLVGSLKLDGTDQAVSSEQAATLLPLWQAYRSLSTSQTAAQAEVDGVLKQIESAMTADQMQAITAMNLTSSDMLALIQTLAPTIGKGTPNPQATPGADMPGGGFMFENPEGGSTGGGSSGPGGSQTRIQPPSGAMPGGGGGPIVIQGGPGLDNSGSQIINGTPDPSMQATAQARFSTQSCQVNTMLLNVLINKLELMTNGG